MPGTRTWVTINIDDEGRIEKIACGKSVDVTVMWPDKTEIVRTLRGEPLKMLKLTEGKMP